MKKWVKQRISLTPMVIHSIGLPLIEADPSLSRLIGHVY